MARSPGSRAPVSRASVSPLPGRGSERVGQGTEAVGRNAAGISRDLPGSQLSYGEGEGPGSKSGMAGRPEPPRPAAGQGKYAMTVSGNHSIDAVGGGLWASGQQARWRGG